MERYVYLYHPLSLAHDTGSHPECAARIEAIERRLAAHKWVGFEREQAPSVSRAALEAVHPAAHIDSIERISHAGGGMIDMDTIVSRDSYDAALRAAGAATRAVGMLLDGDASATFCGLRPPGHHAEAARAMGFCLFNNVAVAARHALSRAGVERVLVFDWDVHHGNGTNDIFYDTDEVLYVSAHQAPLYPGSGALTEDGAGSGSGYTVNLPVPPGSGARTYFGLIDRVIAPIARDYSPQIILVSAGYDAHRRDPLANCELTDEDFGAMSAAMRALADELDAPIGFVLEGGYDLEALAASVEATLRGIRSPATLPAGDDDAVVRSAVAHHAANWPILRS